MTKKDNLKINIDSNIEVNKIIKDHWKMLDYKWEEKRKIIKEIKNNNFNKTKNIDSIKSMKGVLLEKLGFIPVYFFLNIIFCNYNYSGQYRTIDKGIVLLYHLISGNTKNTMSKYVPIFNSLYNEFWEVRNDELNNQIDKFLKTMFSNNKLRLINAYLYNPENLKVPTIIFDIYNKFNNVNHSNRILDSGYFTPFLCDNTGMVIYVADTKKYLNKNNEVVDSNLLFFDVILDINNTDVITIEDKYLKFKNYLIKNTNKKSKNIINDNNFISSINNEDLDSENLQYNISFNEIHSISSKTIDSMEKTFNVFKNNKYKEKSEIYNLQLKTAFLLQNIKMFINKYNIKEKYHHTLWYNNNFDFPTTEFNNNLNIDIKINNQKDKINKMMELQIKQLNF